MFGNSYEWLEVVVDAFMIESKILWGGLVGYMNYCGYCYKRCWLTTSQIVMNTLVMNFIGTLANFYEF